MAIASGTRIGRYEVHSHLGSGGMGDVYRARDLTLNRDVALKFLPADLNPDADRLRRFEQEAQAASALNHPAIVAIYELGTSDGRPFISMELVEGQTLRQLLSRGAVPPKRALRIAAQVASALAKAHAAGIVHRDLKPENVMVSSDDHAKILDFGLAKLTRDDVRSANLSTMIDQGTRPGLIMGTVGYMSPEQATGGAVDFRSDQFSFGLVLHELLTGQRAFERPTAPETLAAIIRDDLPSLDLPQPVPVATRWIIERCLAKDPEDRYASSQDLARDLANLRDHVSDRTAPAGLTPRSRISRREIVAWSAVVLLGGASLGLFMTSRREAPVEAPPVRLTVEPPPGGAFYLTIGASPFALSPDGRTLAFISTVGGKRQIWMRSLDALEAQPLGGTHGATASFWSPDGKQLGFFADNKMKRVSVSGGDVATICDTRGAGGAAWGPDDVILFTPAAESPLFRVPAAGGAVTPVTTLDPANKEALHMAPAFLPDGRHYVFSALGRDRPGLYLGALDSPERVLLVPDALAIGVGEPDRLYFVLRHRLMTQRVDVAGRKVVADPVLVAEDVASFGPASAAAVSRRGDVVYWVGPRDTTQLTWVRRDGTPAGPVGPPGPFVNVALSPDGKYVAVDRQDMESGIWIVDIARGAATRTTFGNTFESTPVWSPDSRAFVFATARQAPPNLFLKRLDTPGEERRLVDSTLQSFPQSWSRDGLIAFVTIEEKTRNDIWIVPASGERAAWPIVQSTFVETHARISPDGHWLAFDSNENGRPEVYVTAFPQPGEKWIVSVAGGGFPIWRADSKELYYRAPDGRLMAVGISSGGDFKAGLPVSLFTPKATAGGLGAGTFYDVAADGRFLINILVERSIPPAVVVLTQTAR